MAIEEDAGEMAKDLGSFLYLEIADASFHQGMPGLEGFLVPPGTAEIADQVAGCKFIPVGELAGVLGSSKTRESDSHELFKGLRSVLFLSARMVGLKELPSSLSDERYSH